MSGYLNACLRCLRRSLILVAIRLIEEAALLQILLGVALASPSEYLVAQERELIVQDSEFLLQPDNQTLELSNLRR